nr:MAG: hypothetical protein B6I27_01600 [Erwiniaceae bacterium 4572_131]
MFTSFSNLLNNIIMSLAEDREYNPQDFIDWGYENTHVTKDGREIPLNKLDLSHLKNIIRWIERKAKEGVKISYGGGVDAEDIWYDEYILYGNDALNELDYKKYIKELKRREK